MKRVLAAYICSALLMLLLPTRIYAATYDVNAVVPFPPPTSPAVFDSSFDGKTVSSSLLSLTGTCQYNAPGTVVQILRNALNAGSVSCNAGGIFQIDIQLVSGNNLLIARSASITSNYGPDSSAVNVIFTPPVVPPTTTTGPQKDVLAQEQSSLSIRSEQSFVAIDTSNKTVSVQVVVDGGETPYTLEINWGDGTVQKKQVTSPGSYTFEHTYQKAGSYKAVAIVTDVKGVQRLQYFAVVSPGALSEGSDKGSTEPETVVCGVSTVHLEECTAVFPWVKVILFTALGVFVFVNGVLVGMWLIARRAHGKKAVKRAKR